MRERPRRCAPGVFVAALTAWMVLMFVAPYELGPSAFWPVFCVCGAVTVYAATARQGG